MCRQELDSSTAQVFALLFLLWVLSRFQGPEHGNFFTVCWCHCWGAIPPCSCPFSFGLAGLRENAFGLRVHFVLGFEEWAYYVQHHVQHPKKNTISIKMGMLMSKFVLKNLSLIQSLIIIFMSKFVFPAQSLSNLLSSCSRL